MSWSHLTQNFGRCCSGGSAHLTSPHLTHCPPFFKARSTQTQCWTSMAGGIAVRIPVFDTSCCLVEWAAVEGRESHMEE